MATDGDTAKWAQSPRIFYSIKHTLFKLKFQSMYFI